MGLVSAEAITSGFTLTAGQGKTIQVIAFLSAIMRKTGYSTDDGRRRKHVAVLQDEDPDWRKNLPPANATWPTALIIAPSSVAVNWEREFEKVCFLTSRFCLLANT
jgi:SNF2 family DNA or RNA helicase